ncbi:MAG: GNAT family N-acetyltransferase [Bacteroidetes bacterium]|jgi:GNAT superfamily N-acetyltransferase|nr:GNAT family N-acetyltransferase [Bacteroidota bacterium]
MTIRRANAVDLPALTRVAHAAKQHWGYPDAWVALWRDALTFTAATLEQCAVFCMEHGADVVAVYALSVDGQDAELEHFWVDPACMGQGVGRQLLTHARTQARAHGARQLRIASDPHAEGFYRAMGARRIGTVPSVPAGRTLPLLVLDVEL